MPPKKQPTKTGNEAIRHNEKRMNIPTEELRDFVTVDEHAPSVLRYLRDTSLDPQLLWKGTLYQYMEKILGVTHTLQIVKS